MDSITLVRATRHDLTQKNNLIVPLTHRDVEIADATALLGEFGQLVIVGCEESARFDFVVEKFRHAPCDGQPIERGCSSADLIENDETSLRGVVDDVGSFIHFDHERGLATGKIVIRPDAGENAIDQADLRAFRRNEAADLRHQHN